MRRFSICLHLALAIAVAGAVSLTGCGSGLQTFPVRSAPTAQTRQQLQNLAGRQQMAMAQSPNAAGMNAAQMGRPGLGGMIFGGRPLPNNVGIAAAPAGRNATAKNARIPMIGAFVASVAGRAAGKPGLPIRALRQGSRAETAFYFDEYLGLWVSVNEDPGSFKYLLFEDEGKTKPAGHFTTAFPATDQYPYLYDSVYEVTAGTLAGAHGSYHMVINQDQSATTTYDNSMPGGYSDRGASSWKADGSSQWSSRSEGPNGYFYETAGTFNADGSGKTSSSDSQGYATQYQYRSDGTGTGVIQGPDPGLPATIEWFADGLVRITWADGTVEEWRPEWTVSNSGGGGVEGGTDGGNSSSGSSSGSTGDQTGRRPR